MFGKAHSIRMTVSRIGEAFRRSVEGFTDFFELEYRVRTKSGEYLWILTRGKTVERDESGRPSRLAGTFIDISKRKAMETALGFEREQLLSIFDSVNAIVDVVDPRTYELLYMNRYSKDLVGRDATGALCYEVFHGYESPCEFCMNELVMQLRGDPYHWEYHSERLNRDFIATNRMIKWPDGRDVKLELSFDITDRKNLEGQLLQAQKMEAVGTLAGGIAHDFNNLLQVVMGYTEILIGNQKPGSPDFEDLGKIYAAGKRGAELVRNLLTFSRRLEPKFTNVDLNREVLEFQKLLSRTIPRTIKIVLRSRGSLNEIMADSFSGGAGSTESWGQCEGCHA